MLVHGLNYYIYIYAVCHKNLVHVKRHHGRLCLHPDSLLYAVGCSFWGIDLAMDVLGEFAKGLVVSGAAAYITLV